MRMLNDLSAGNAVTPGELDKLKRAAHENSPDATKAAATQFEAVLLGMVLKSMREATPQNGPFDSEQSRMMTSMLDQQLSQSLASRGIGLAKVLERQLSPKAQISTSASAPAAPSASATTTPTTPQAKSTSLSANTAENTAAIAPKSSLNRHNFSAKLKSFAETASAATGIPARFMLAQAALESGWGKRSIKLADGSDSHNLFGIKAGSHWKGKVAEVFTTEYVDGLPKKILQKFRAYDSPAEAFADYAAVLKRSPRYSGVIASASDAAGFAQGMQKAGYATDPQYANKLMRMMASKFA